MTSSCRAVMVVLLVWAALGCHRQPPFLKSGDVLYYIYSNKVYKYDVSQQNKPVVVYDPEQEFKGDVIRLADLCKINESEMLTSLDVTLWSEGKPFENIRHEYRLIKINARSGIVTEIYTSGPVSLLKQFRNEDGSTQNRAVEYSRHAASADGQKVAAYVSGEYKISVRRFQGTNTQEDLYNFDVDDFVLCPPFPCSFSPDGKTLTLSGISQTYGSCIFLLNLDSKQMVLWRRALEGVFSPDGTRIAYSTETAIVVEERDTIIHNIHAPQLLRIDHWIDDTKIVFTAVKYLEVCYVGIADLDSGAVFRIDPPVKGSIDGACLFRF
mgnify:FL=1